MAAGNHCPRIVRRPVPAVALPGHLHPVLRRVYAARGITHAGELDLGLPNLLDYRALKGVEAAAALLERALNERWRILVVGDFDADGATATALALDTLRRMGAAHVGYRIPDRIRDGYGLSPAIVEAAAADRPDLILTVDNGIASVAGVAAARERGIRVLITDHHLPGEVLPAADALVNPNQPGCAFSSKALAGVGVLFYVLLALRARLRAAGWFAARSEPALAEALDLVAIGTVADVVPLDRNNRILVAQGLRRIRAGRARPGIYALLRSAGRDPARVTSADIGFAVGPRLNAAGRLDDMGLGVACLLAEAGDADAAAHRLDELNSERRTLQAQMQDHALAAIEAAEAELDAGLPAGLCVHAKEWHEGIVGLVAARVRQRYHRPTVALAPAAEAGLLKGSARSIPGIHIRDLLANLAARHPGLVHRFGGHAAAAGLTLAAANLPAFRDAFADEVARLATPQMLDGVLESDGPLGPDELNLETARALRGAGPWGSAFPEPQFDCSFQVRDQCVVGGGHLKLQLQLPGSERVHDGIAFGRDAPVAPEVQLVYRPDANLYRGNESLQLVVTHVVEGPG